MQTFANMFKICCCLIDKNSLSEKGTKMPSRQKPRQSHSRYVVLLHFVCGHMKCYFSMLPQNTINLFYSSKTVSPAFESTRNSDRWRCQGCLRQDSQSSKGSRDAKSTDGQQKKEAQRGLLIHYSIFY